MRVEKKRVPTWHRQEAYKAFIDRYGSEKARPLFFVGSGISINAGLPNWKSLLINLAKQMRDSSRYDAIVSLLEDRDLSKYQRAGSLIKKYFATNERGVASRWRQALGKILNDPKTIGEKSPIHDLLIAANWHRMITTNYDCLIEKALERAGRLEGVDVTNPWRQDFASAPMSEKPALFKIHGDISARESPIVLTEEEYRHLYIEKNPEYFAETLHTLFRSASVTLFIGYSHDDAFVRNLYSQAMRGIKPGSAFALVPQPYGYDDIAAFENKLANLTSELGLRFIYYSPDRSHQELLSFLAELNEPKRPSAYYNVENLIRKPTVIMLYCGGTIGSEEQKQKHDGESVLGVSVKHSRFDPSLRRFSQRLLSWYYQVYSAVGNLDLNIEWEILSPDYQLLSENATPETWNAIVAKIDEIVYKYFYGPSLVRSSATVVGKRLKSIYKEESEQYSSTYPTSVLSESQFRSNFEQSYVLGIVLLHGTDTLAYTASALCFGLNNMPCSVVVTGANYPPEFRNLREYSPFYNSSDAWRNLMTSLYFLQNIGHRLTEVFVCFGDTIHNGINLRKAAIDFVPTSREVGSRYYEEPFVFRNKMTESQYMFKLIDGLLCNNYYSSAMPYSVLLEQRESGESRDLRHVRWDALLPVPRRELLTFYFSADLAYVKISPTTLPVTISRQTVRHLRLVLVEGYESGTYPTTPKHPFAPFLASLYELGIPVVLISHHGIRATQQEYVTVPVSGHRIPVLRLYGVIAETALPLLALILFSLRDRWGSRGASSSKIVTQRIEVIKSEIRKHFETRDNILSEELKFIVDQRDMHEKVRLREESMREQSKARRRDYSERGEIDLRRLATQVRRDLGVDSNVTLSRKEFRLILEEIARPLGRIGAGPDGFALVSDMGFEFGLSLATSSARRRFRRQHGLGQKLLFELRVAERSKLKEAAEAVLHDVVKILRSTAMGDVEVSQSLEVVVNSLEEREDTTCSMTFGIALSEYFERTGRDELYHTESSSELNEMFFEALTQGPREGMEPDDYAEHIRELYDKLLRDAWIRPMTILYWFMIGFFKGVGCELVGLLRLGNRAGQWWLHREDGDREHALRQALECRIVEATGNFLSLRFSYRE